MQVELFDISSIAIESKVKINWSFSKIDTFKGCPRKYYYRYYGSKKRNALKEKDKYKLIELSKIENLALVQGKIMHQLIGIFFKKAKSSEAWDKRRLESFSNKILDDLIEYNKNIKNDLNLRDSKYPIPIIKELYYNKITSEQFRERLNENFRLCFNNFFNSNKFSFLIEGGKKIDSIIENNSSFKLTSNIIVEGKIDIAFIEGDRLIIADWKTGKTEIEETSLQLLVYALWAKNKEQWKDLKTEIIKAYLLVDKLESLEFSNLHIERAKVRILQDAELFKEMDEFGRNAVADAFMRCNQEKVCKLCSYEELCYQIP